MQSEVLIRVFDIALNSNFDLRTESLWVISNAITTEEIQIRLKMWENYSTKLVAVLIAGLEINNSGLLRNILEAVEALLSLDD